MAPFTLYRTCVKCLGIQIDNQLKWKEHIASVSLKVSRAAGMIKYAKKLLPKETLKLLYRGLVEPAWASNLDTLSGNKCLKESDEGSL